MFENKEPDAILKLIDFGLSNKFSDKFGHTHAMNTTVGTPYYVAPEVLRGHYGPKCDIWSAGVIMFVLLSGQYPFVGRTESEIFRGVRK